MRRWTFALAVIALTACNKEQASQDVRQTDRELASDDLTANDLTAIDAASAADSNMAADIDVANMALNLDEDEGGNATRESSARRSVPARNGEAPRNQSSESEDAPANNETAPSQPDNGAN
ncbi:hypothetical protein G7076_07210 [Sphingomonas sp. HDW15A]|uniref:hypothetical protein n=1 Tax=Sphingomonas sp. HDW15A TaxID=2714942 RepID=UPI0014098418|nr:hypothetical protein [Sphingomonas sp. HDW15A]QIK96263.1 hypothetical protein G7076_07210 [Sphingomonas sp. HDW15A]